MVGERTSSHSPENASENSDVSGGDTEYPPFDLEKAKELVENVRILESTEDLKANQSSKTENNTQRFAPNLYANESEWRVENPDK